MLRITLLLCAVPAAFSIIVRDPPPSPNDYKYSYDVQDPTTGDSKSQHEVRQGDVVTGAYTVVGPDGTKRTVEYTADAKHGFKAVVSEEPAEAPPVTHQPIAHYHPVATQEFDTYPYHATPRTVYKYTSVQPQYKANFVQENPVYFTPQNEIERLPFESGHYFIPANGK